MSYYVDPFYDGTQLSLKHKILTKLFYILQNIEGIISMA